MKTKEKTIQELEIEESSLIRDLNLVKLELDRKRGLGVFSNSLALGKQKPLAKNKQFAEICENCKINTIDYAYDPCCSEDCWMEKFN